MDNSILVKYIDRIYGYALNKSFSHEEASELSQEILVTAIKQLHTLKNEESFEQWLWGVANNVTKVFRRSQGKQRAMYSYDALDTAEHIDEYPSEQIQICEMVRSKVVKLSKLYRDIIILYYYDNLSCKEIAEKLSIPEGTVTWRLSEGRRKLKKECVDMTETVLRPIKMTIRINGEGNYNGRDIPFPWVFISDALSQNILYHCYRKSNTIEELSKLCGIPAFYIEDTINNLLYREALIEQTKGKYLTNFIIYGTDTAEYNKKAEIYLHEIVEDFVCALKVFTESVLNIGIYTANKDKEELYYLFGILAFEYLYKNHTPVKHVPYNVRYDGNRWTYHAYLEGSSTGNGLGIEKSLNEGSEGKLAHYSYHFGGFSYRNMMETNKINICEKIIKNREYSEKEQIANLIKDGYLKRLEDGEIVVDIPFLTLEQKHKFDQLAERSFADIMPRIVEAIEKYIEGYKKLFPIHLEYDVQRACNFMFVGFFVNIVTLAQEKNLLKKPQEGSICDVLIEHK